MITYYTQGIQSYLTKKKTFSLLCTEEVDMRPELDEEIDFLSSIITKHRESEVKHTGNTFVLF